MGNNPSIPEKVLAAVVRNDVPKLTKLMDSLRTNGPADPAERARILEYKDKNGRTPLITAAAKNHYQILQQLVALGANVHYLNPSRSAFGSALHEAAARRHEAVVELLLAAGANPFVANAAGRTALDEAVLSGHAGVVRAIEKRAEFSGLVSFKTRSLGGLSSKYKVRWAVLMPYHPFSRDTANVGGSASGGGGASGGGIASGAAPTAATPNSQEVRRARRCLWLYKDQTSISPRCRLWVDGATVSTHGPAGNEGTLRLHTSHGEPMGDLATSYNHGYCVGMRPADLTPGAAATYQRLVALLNTPVGPPTAAVGAAPTATPTLATASFPVPVRPPPQPLSVPPHSAVAVGVAGGAPQPTGVTLPVVIPPAVSLATSPMVPAGGFAVYPAIPGPYGSSMPLYVPGPAPVPPPLPAAAPPPPPPPGAHQHFDNAAAPGVGGSIAAPPNLHLQDMQQLQQQRARQRASSSVPSSMAGAQHTRHELEPIGARRTSDPVVMPAQPSQGTQQQLQQHGHVVAVDAVAGFIEQMSALQGESDEDFAARLASAISAASGQSQEHLFTQKCQPQSVAQTAAVATTPSDGRPSSSRPSTSRPSAPTHSVDRRHDLNSGGSSSAAGGSDSTTSVNLINFQSDPGVRTSSSLDVDVAVNQPMGPSDSASGGAGGGNQLAAAASGLDDLDVDAINAHIASEVAAAAAAAVFMEEPPSAPLAPAGDVGAPRSSQQQVTAPQDQDIECIICLSAPKEVGFLHGNSVHRCVCRACSVLVAIGTPCPLCRQPVERVIGVY